MNEAAGGGTNRSASHSQIFALRKCLKICNSLINILNISYSGNIRVPAEIFQMHACLSSERILIIVRRRGSAMIAELIGRYKSASRQLEEAVARDDRDSVHALDRQIQGHWKALLDCCPDAREDALMLASFLVGMLAADSHVSEIQSQAAARILRLLEDVLESRSAA